MSRDHPVPEALGVGYWVLGPWSWVSGKESLILSKGLLSENFLACKQGIRNPKLCNFNFLQMEYFRIGVRLTVGFLVIGTLILIVFYFTLSAKVAMFTYLYTAVAVFVNWVYTAFLLYNLLRGRISGINTLKTVGLMALAIPVAMVYAEIMIVLTSHARITFKNTTGNNIALIKVEGCDQKQIQDLDNGESKTVWIKIPVTCKVEIEYELNGIQKKETVAGYLNVSGAVIATYEVGSNRDVLEGS